MTRTIFNSQVKKQKKNLFLLNACRTLLPVEIVFFAFFSDPILVTRQPVTESALQTQSMDDAVDSGKMHNQIRVWGVPQMTSH